MDKSILNIEITIDKYLTSPIDYTVSKTLFTDEFISNEYEDFLETKERLEKNAEKNRVLAAEYRLEQLKLEETKKAKFDSLVSSFGDNKRIDFDFIKDESTKRFVLGIFYGLFEPGERSLDRDDLFAGKIQHRPFIFWDRVCLVNFYIFANEIDKEYYQKKTKMKTIEYSYEVGSARNPEKGQGKINVEDRFASLVLESLDYTIMSLYTAVGIELEYGDYKRDLKALANYFQSNREADYRFKDNLYRYLTGQEPNKD